MSNTEDKAANPKSGHKVNRAAVVLQALMIPVLIAGGWFLRGMMPSAPAGGPPGGSMGGAGGPPTVVVASVRQGTAEEPQEFVGHVEAIQAVDLVPQVAGYLDAVHFEEGSPVEEGDLLFTIEQEPFRARLALSEAALQQAESSLPAAKADLNAAKANFDRADKYLKRLQSADERSVVQANLDAASADFLQAQARVEQAQAAVQQAEAAVQQAKANLQLARIDLAYTEIRAPIAGRIGEALVTKGNYVNPASGPLARIVQMDPIRVVFSVPDREHLALLRKTAKEGEAAVETRLLLPDGAVFPDQGRRDFDDNEMDPQTGTIAVRARFDNAAGLLIPKTYVTVLLTRKAATTVLLVPAESVMTDQQGGFVYVVDGENAVEQRRVVLGAEIEGNRVVERGLSADEQVIVRGIQKVRPGQTVQVAPDAGSKGA